MSASLQAVRVHPDGAQVVRVLKNCTPGATIEIPGIAASASAFYVKGGGVKLASIRSVLEPPADVGTAAVRDLAQDCRDFIKRSRLALSKRAVLRSQRALLCSALQKQAVSAPAVGVSGYSESGTSGFLGFVDTTDKKLVEIGHQECENDGELAELKVEEMILKNRIERLNDPQVQYHRQGEFENFVDQLDETLSQLKLGCRWSQIITLTVGDTATEIKDIEVHYVVRGVTWKPAYNILCQGSSEITLEYFADIGNHCGEDWNEVSIHLERSHIEGMCTPPRCPAQQVQFETPAAPPTAAPAAFGGMRLKRALHANAVMDDAAVSEVEGQGIAASFKLKNRATLLSKPGTQRILITRQQLADCKALHWVALEDPATQGQTYNAKRVIYAKNSTGFEMLPAAAQVFLNGEFEGVNYLEGVRVNRPFSLCIGCDSKITVVEQKARDLIQITGILGTTTARVHTVRYALKNSGKEPQKVFVVANCPITTDTAAKVTLAKPQAQTEVEFEDDLAAAVWLDNVDNGSVRNAVTGNIVEKITLTAESIIHQMFEFAVAVPQGKEVSLVLV